MQTIGVPGSGEVGRTLAQGLKTHGYGVRIGSRTPAKLAGFSASSEIQAGSFSDVAGWAELLVLSAHGAAAEAALTLAGRGNVKGKTVIDTTNPITDAPPIDGVVQFFTGPNSSLRERLQAAFPEAPLVKAFNSVGSARMVNPVFAGGRPTMFYCGNDDTAKARVAARAIEPLCRLWCIPGFRQDSWTHAFKVLWS